MEADLHVYYKERGYSGRPPLASSNPPTTRHNNTFTLTLCNYHVVNKIYALLDNYKLPNRDYNVAGWIFMPKK